MIHENTAGGGFAVDVKRSLRLRYIVPELRVSKV